jgi:proline iminopeptidase
MVEDIEQLRKHLGAQKIDLIGHSFGTILAMEYAARYHRQVSRMVLASPVPNFPQLIESLCQRLETDDIVAYMRAVQARDETTFPRCNPFAAYDGAALKDYLDRNMFPDLETAQQVEAADSVDELGNSGESTNALIDQGLFLYKFTKFDAVRMPVLLIAGKRDFEAPIDLQAALARELRNATLIEYGSSGHFMFVEQPKRFTRDVCDFLLSTASFAPA